MIECKECNGQISTKAAACPHCGNQNGPSAEDYQYGFAFVFVILLIAGFWLFL